MTTTAQDLRALAYLAERLRADGSLPTWHTNGITAALSGFEGQPLAQVVERVTRHAADPEARTPAAVLRPFVPDAQPDRWQPTPGPWCSTCGVARGVHTESDHEFERRQERRRPPEAMAAIVQDARQRMTHTDTEETE